MSGTDKPEPRPCPVCGTDMAGGGGIDMQFLIGSEVIGSLCIRCAARGTLWAARMALAEQAIQDELTTNVRKDNPLT